jgi:hypothetical protein
MHSNLLPINSQFSFPIITGLGLSTNYHCKHDGHSPGTQGHDQQGVIGQQTLGGTRVRQGEAGRA